MRLCASLLAIHTEAAPPCLIPPPASYGFTAPQGGTFTYRCDPVNRLTSLNSSSDNVVYAYDFNGNLQAKGNSQGVTFFVYDSENRLTEVQLPLPADRVAYDSHFVQRGNQSGGFTGSLGMDFNVNTPIQITQMGAFDPDAWDGRDLTTPITVSIYNRTTQQPVPGTTVTFAAGTPPPPLTGDIFQAITPVVLPQGEYSVVASGFNLASPNGNIGAPGVEPASLDDDHGVISFVGWSRFGLPGLYPTNTDGGPANRYLAGTFQYRPATFTDGGQVFFKYDPFGRRISKSGPLGTTIYLYDGPNVVAELDETGALKARYVQSLGVDEPLAQVASSVNYYQADALGSITSLTDNTGTITATYKYESFGNLIESTGTVPNSYRYTGREYDEETGLYYYRARYYDPSIGRFISEDPIGFLGGINPYAYVNNNPVGLYDPWGLMGWEYNVTRKNHGWGFLQDASFQPELPPTISVDCQCAGNGKYKATVKVSFNVMIWYGTQGQLKHENQHLEIMQNYLNGRTDYYANTYEHMYSSKEECEKSAKAIDKDLLADWQNVKKLEDAHDDYLQNAIQWVFDKATGKRR